MTLLNPFGVIVICPWHDPAGNPVGSATTVSCAGVVPVVFVTFPENFNHVTPVQLCSLAPAKKNTDGDELDTLLTFKVCCETVPPIWPENVRLLLSVVT